MSVEMVPLKKCLEYMLKSHGERGSLFEKKNNNMMVHVGPSKKKRELTTMLKFGSVALGFIFTRPCGNIKTILQAHNINSKGIEHMIF